MAQRKKMFEAVVHGIFLLLGLITVGCVLLITVYLIISGIPAIQKIGLVPFLTGKVWSSTSAEPKYGILPFILTSVYGTAGAIVLGVPIGFLTAVYLSKVAPKKVRTVLEAAVSLLAGIPSVVYGLVGMLVLVPAIRKTFHLPDGASLFAAIIVLAVMILPSIIKVSVTALEAVPHEYEDASLALGATEVETYFRVSVPAAKSGIAAAVVLGVGRAIGEAMAVMMVSGNAPNMPGSIFESVRFLTTAVASEMSYSSGLQRQALFSIALVLYLFILLINAALNFFLKRDKEGPPQGLYHGDEAPDGRRRSIDLRARSRYDWLYIGQRHSEHHLGDALHRAELSCQPRRHPAGHPEHALHRHRDAFNRAAARRGRGHLLK